MTPLLIPEGTSEPQDVRLLSDGLPFDGTPYSIDLELVERTGTSIGSPAPAIGSPAPTIAWLDAANGVARILGVDILEVATYSAVYRVSGFGWVGYFPNQGEPHTWEVYRRLP